MKNNLTYLLFAEIDNLLKREKKGRKKMSKLTDAVAALKMEVADLKTRFTASEQAHADELAAVQAESDAAAADVTGVAADVKAIDAGAATPPTSDTL